MFPKFTIGNEKNPLNPEICFCSGVFLFSGGWIVVFVWTPELKKYTSTPFVWYIIYSEIIKIIMNLYSRQYNIRVSKVLRWLEKWFLFWKKRASFKNTCLMRYHNLGQLSKNSLKYASINNTALPSINILLIYSRFQNGGLINSFCVRNTCTIHICDHTHTHTSVRACV